MQLRADDDVHGPLPSRMLPADMVVIIQGTFFSLFADSVSMLMLTMANV